MALEILELLYLGIVLYDFPQMEILDTDLLVEDVGGITANKAFAGLCIDLMHILMGRT